MRQELNRFGEKMQKIFLWLKLETGGLGDRLESGELGCEKYPVFEVSAIITDSELTEIDTYRAAVFAEDADINSSTEYALKIHKESGLISEVMDSGIMIEDAERIIIEKLKMCGAEPFGSYQVGVSAHLAGQSLAHEQAFILTKMPRLKKFLHHYPLDVASLMMGLSEWGGESIQDRWALCDYDDTNPNSKIRRAIQGAKFIRNCIQ